MSLQLVDGDLLFAVGAKCHLALVGILLRGARHVVLLDLHLARSSSGLGLRLLHASLLLGALSYPLLLFLLLSRQLGLW